jgi:hypothetical protein
MSEKGLRDTQARLSDRINDRDPPRAKEDATVLPVFELTMMTLVFLMVVELLGPMSTPIWLAFIVAWSFLVAAIVGPAWEKPPSLRA